MHDLPQAPPALAEDGAPAFGLFAGAVESPTFAQLTGPWARGFVERRLIEKKWQYLFVPTPDAMLALAIIDTGYLASGICAVFDRGGRRLLCDENPVLPAPCVSISEEPNDGLHARLFGPGVRARIERSAGRMLVSARWGVCSVELVLEARAAPAPATAIAPVGEPGRFDFTQKTVLLPCSGEVRAGNVRFEVRDAFGALDYTHGYLARETSWRWAFGCGQSSGRQIALNFSEGFLQGAGENVVWIDGAPRAVGAVRFEPGGAPLAPWRLRGDGVELTFQPEGQRAQTIDLKLILSKYVQPFGTFSGRVGDVTVDALPGVTEDHAARW